MCSSSPARAAVEPFRISLFADVQRCVNVHLDKGSANHPAYGCPGVGIGTDESTDDGASVLDDLTSNESGAQDIQVAVFFSEAKPGGKHLAHRAIAVEHGHNATTLFEFGLQGFGYRGFPGSRQSGKPDAKAISMVLSVGVHHIAI